MVKQISSPSPERDFFLKQISCFFDSSALPDWLAANKRLLVGIGLGGLAFLLLVYRLLSWGSIDAEKNDLTAQRDFHLFQQWPAGQASLEERLDALKGLEKIMERQIGLQQAYQGGLAQTLLLMDLPKEADRLAAPLFQRNQSGPAPFHLAYGKTSLLIAQKEYQTALLEAETLKRQMDAELVPLDTLYALNLVRIAALQQQLGHLDLEKETWDELKSNPIHRQILLNRGFSNLKNWDSQ